MEHTVQHVVDSSTMERRYNFCWCANTNGEASIGLELVESFNIAILQPLHDNTCGSYGMTNDELSPKRLWAHTHGRMMNDMLFMFEF